jgi:hypothetical protein
VCARAREFYTPAHSAPTQHSPCANVSRDRGRLVSVFHLLKGDFPRACALCSLRCIIRRGQINSLMQQFESFAGFPLSAAGAVEEALLARRQLFERTGRRMERRHRECAQGPRPPPPTPCRQHQAAALSSRSRSSPLLCAGGRRKRDRTLLRLWRSTGAAAAATGPARDTPQQTAIDFVWCPNISGRTRRTQSRPTSDVCV